jgi:peptidyl-prolyl cis-trans isomerase D
VAAADKLKVEWKPGLKRGNAQAGLSTAAIAEIFRTPQGGAGTVEGTSPTERIVFHVGEIKVPPLDPEAADSKRIDEALKSRITDDLNSQYVMRLREEVGVSINQSALSQVSGGGQQNY